MPSSLANAVRAHHAELRQKLTEKVGAYLSTGSPEAFQDLVDFLSGELLPHARAEERHLYAAVEPLIKAWGRATATMEIDHRFIEGYIDRLKAGSAPDPEALKRLAVGLEAIVLLHLEKEERVYLPLLDIYLPAADQDRVLAGLRAEESEAPGSPAVRTTLDVRMIPPPQRHPLIFQTFESLGPGEAFILVNDHDPKPLYYQFKAERPGIFGWTYLEQGPAVWRVLISRTG